jgi:hypothetical protein
MIKRLMICIALLAMTDRVSIAQSTTDTQQPAAKPAAKTQTAEQLNTQAYIKLLREDVNAEKATLMGKMMQLDAEDSAKFWPIYRDYSVELNKINDLRVANIKEYAENYTQMTDARADELIKNAISYQRQRVELLAKSYELMKRQLGSIAAARFAQIENQLLLIIDLEITSSLPVVGS